MTRMDPHDAVGAGQSPTLTKRVVRGRGWVVVVGGFVKDGQALRIRKRRTDTEDP